LDFVGYTGSANSHYDQRRIVIYLAERVLPPVGGPFHIAISTLGPAFESFATVASWRDP
jgi:hypothetical protein